MRVRIGVGHDRGWRWAQRPGVAIVVLVDQPRTEFCDGLGRVRLA